MNFKTFSDVQLIDELKQTVSKERDATLRVLWLLREVERRMLYAARGYSSLFQYCVSELKYSESSAQRRISSMRLLKDLSELDRKAVEAKIANGNLNLSHLSQVQTHLRNQAAANISSDQKYSEKSLAGKNVASNSQAIKKPAPLQSQDRIDLIDKVAGTSSRQCEQILASLLPEPPLEQERKRPISAEHYRVTLIVSNELMKKIEHIQNTRAHQLKENTILEILTLLVEEETKRDEKKKGVAKDLHPTSVGQKDTVAELAAKIKTQSRYIPRKTYRQLYQEADHQCQFTDPLTKRRCDSKHKLQIEHCQPFSLGGTNEPENLKLLCSNHNIFMAKNVFGFDTRQFQRP